MQRFYTKESVILAMVYTGWSRQEICCGLSSWSLSLESAGESGVSVPENFFGGWTLLCRNYFFFQKAPAFRFYIPGIRDIPGTRDIPGKSARYIASALKTNFFKPATSV